MSERIKIVSENGERAQLIEMEPMHVIAGLEEGTYEVMEVSEEESKALMRDSDSKPRQGVEFFGTIDTWINAATRSL